MKKKGGKERLLKYVKHSQPCKQQKANASHNANGFLRYVLTCQCAPQYSNYCGCCMPSYCTHCHTYVGYWEGDGYWEGSMVSTHPQVHTPSPFHFPFPCHFLVFISLSFPHSHFHFPISLPPPIHIPTGDCEAPNAIVASIDLSPHSATKIIDATCKNDVHAPASVAILPPFSAAATSSSASDSSEPSSSASVLSKPSYESVWGRVGGCRGVCLACTKCVYKLCICTLKQCIHACRLLKEYTLFFFCVCVYIYTVCMLRMACVCFLHQLNSPLTHTYLE